MVAFMMSEVSDIMAGCGMVATIQTDWETDKEQEHHLFYLDTLWTEGKQDRKHTFTHLFFQFPVKQFKICYVILALSLCKNMWKPEMLVRECLIVIFYEDCLFLFLWNVLLWQKFLSLGISSAWNESWDEVLKSALLSGEYEERIDFLTLIWTLRKALSKISSSNLKLLLHEVHRFNSNWQPEGSIGSKYVGSSYED